MKKHSFIRNLFKKMTIGKLLGISSIVLFFLGLFFAVNKIHGAGTLRYIQVDVGAGAEGPYVGAPFIIKDEYGNNYWEYQSDEYGEIQFCIDSDNGRCELGYEDLGKIFYISEDCDSFHDDTYVCDKSAVKVSVEADGVGDPYARYFYLDEYGNQGEEVYFSPGDDQYIFNNKIKDCIEIKSKVKALGLEEGQFEFDLRDIYGAIKQTTTNNESGDIKFCVDTDGTYLITQNFNNAPDGYIIDSAIIKVSVQDDGYGNKNIQYHKDYYLGSQNEGLCFEGEDVNYLGWGYQYEIHSYPYHYNSYYDDYVSWDSRSEWDWNNYVNSNGGGYWSDYYDFEDMYGYPFYNRKPPVCIEIETSVDSNKTIQSGQFEFGLYNNNYYYNNGISFSTAKNNGSGVIIFSELDDDGGDLSEYDSCDTDIGGNTQGDYSRLCYDIDYLFESQGEYPSYNNEFQYLVGQKTYASGCNNYDCDTGAVRVDVSLTCDSMYNCNASLTYSDTGFFNAIYTATFDANGADSIGADIITGVTITMPSITRHGYLALGWSTDSGATVAEYAVGESVTLTGDVTLYAIIRPATATFLPGQTVNLRLKSLATGATVTNVHDVDTLIQQVVRTGTIPAGVTTGLLSTNDSDTSIIAWFDDGILYYYSEADILYLYQDSYGMFYKIQSGTYIDTSGWDTSKVTNMSYMFNGCSSLTGLDVSDWNTSNVTSMTYMFNGCSSLTELDVSEWNTSNVINMSDMFNGCSSLESLDVSNWDTSSVTNMRNMFQGCSNLIELDVGKWDTSSVTNMRNMFNNCSSLTGLDVSDWDTRSVTNMNYMFGGCRSLTGLDVSDWNTSNVTNMQSMFYGCRSLTGLDVGGWDTSKVTNMQRMFSNCSSLTGLDVGGWDTSSVTNMLGMFAYCSSLTELDVSNWDTSKVTNMQIMFVGCSSLESLDVSNWDTSKVTNMQNMFLNCSSLIELDVGGWDTSKVTNMSYMFNGCSSLTGLDVSDWNTSNVTNMSYMFTSCSSLTELDVSGWDTSKVTNMQRMFSSCSKLNTIYASTGFITSGVTDSANMFYNTPKLIGGHGTKFPSLGNTKSGAVLDSESASGYLTYDIAVSYRTITGVELTRQVISVGSSTVAPSITGYNVVGYYTNSGLTTPFDFSQELRTYTEVYVDRVCADGYRLADGACEKILTATFKDGSTVNKILKSLATGATVTNTNDVDTLIQQIVRTGAIPTGVTTGLLSTNDSETPIIARFDSGTIYYYSDADILYLNQNSSYMFYHIQSGTYIDTSGWNTSKVTNMQQMFAGCSKLIGLDVSGWDTSRVTVMSSMFQSCNSITGLNVSNWNTSNVTNMSNMFYGCGKLIGLDVGGWDTSEVTNMKMVFYGCSSLTGLDISNWNTSKVTNMSVMFRDCSSLTGLDVSRWDTSKVTNMGQVFYNCSSLRSLDVSDWDTSRVTDMSFMFSSCSSLTGLDVSNWNTSNVTDMSSMFSNCSSLKNLDVEGWNTSKVTNMGQVFYNCSSLTGLDVSNWNTSKVTNMSSMFGWCSSLTDLNVSHFDTSNVTDISQMFAACGSLTGLDVSSWDTSNMIDISRAFRYCNKLMSLDVNNRNTSNVTNMLAIFDGCSSLTELDVSNWNTNKVVNMKRMFNSCSNLNTIYASTGFITSRVTDSVNMFSSTPKLIGGHGTKYNRSIVDKTRAVLDSESQLGYLTYDIAVSYRTRSGVELARQVIDVGDTTVAPSIIRTGYAVSGWYTDTGLTTLFDFSQSLRKYTELYVMWKCDTGYMLSGDGVTCIPLTYEVRHFIKNAGALSYTLSGTEIFTGIAGEQVYFDDLSQTYPSCIVYSRGSLTGDENGPGEIETKTDISGDGSTVINLYYDRNTYTVDLSRDFGIDLVEGAGTYECGQEVQIRAYPIDGYHFDMWEGNVDD